MKTSVLKFIKNENGGFHAVFKNNHARQIYLALFESGDTFTIEECYYLDRSTKKRPKALTFEPFSRGELADKIARELDKRFSKIRFLDNPILTEEELISSYLSDEKKRILLMLREGNVLRTVFKNKYHRAIYFEVTLTCGRALISDCHYADTRSREVPQGLTTIYFPFSMERLLAVVNTELEGGFSDVAISKRYTIVLDRPICGSI